jgi:hypothetical protein
VYETTLAKYQADQLAGTYWSSREKVPYNKHLNFLDLEIPRGDKDVILGFIINL